MEPDAGGGRHAHEQVAVKVNAFVDRDVAPLIEALNAVDGVVTLDSCQGAAVGDGLQSVVYFHLGPDGGEDWHALAELVGQIAARLRALDLCCGFAARLEWLGSNDRPRAQLIVQPEHVADVAAGLRDWSEGLSPRTTP
jgi:hypothetical protein